MIQLTRLFFFLFILSGALISSSAFAQKTDPCENLDPCYLNGEETPITESSLALLGKGLKGKQSNQVLVAACVGKDHGCEIIRFAFFPTENKGYWVGPYLKTKNLNLEKGILYSSQKALKSAVKQFIKDTYEGSEAVHISIVFGSWIGGLILGLTGGPLIVVGGLIAVGLTGAVVGTHSNANFFDPSRVFARGMVDGTPDLLTSQNGWNWGTDPSPTREKFIRDFLDRLHDSYRVRNFTEFEIIPAGSSQDFP